MPSLISKVFRISRKSRLSLAKLRKSPSPGFAKSEQQKSYKGSSSTTFLNPFSRGHSSISQSSEQLPESVGEKPADSIEDFSDIHIDQINLNSQTTKASSQVLGDDGTKPENMELYILRHSEAEHTSGMYETVVENEGALAFPRPGTNSDVSETREKQRHPGRNRKPRELSTKTFLSRSFGSILRTISVRSAAPKSTACATHRSPNGQSYISGRAARRYRSGTQLYASHSSPELSTRDDRTGHSNARDHDESQSIGNYSFECSSSQHHNFVQGHVPRPTSDNEVIYHQPSPIFSEIYESDVPNVRNSKNDKCHHEGYVFQLESDDYLHVHPSQYYTSNLQTNAKTTQNNPKNLRCSSDSHTIDIENHRNTTFADFWNQRMTPKPLKDPGLSVPKAPDMPYVIDMNNAYRLAKRPAPRIDELLKSRRKHSLFERMSSTGDNKACSKNPRYIRTSIEIPELIVIRAFKIAVDTELTLEDYQDLEYISHEKQLTSGQG